MITILELITTLQLQACAKIKGFGPKHDLIGVIPADPFLEYYLDLNKNGMTIQLNLIGNLKDLTL